MSRFAEKHPNLTGRPINKGSRRFQDYIESLWNKMTRINEAGRDATKTWTQIFGDK